MASGVHAYALRENSGERPIGGDLNVFPFPGISGVGIETLSPV